LPQFVARTGGPPVQKVNEVKNVPWILLSAALTILAFWIVVGHWYPNSSILLFLVTVFFLALNIGTIWMLYVAVRFEKQPLPFVFLAFIPFAFLWYYFQRVRFGKHLTRAHI
jgi:hypothetical protein